MKCAICGRTTRKPAAMIGTQAVGPKCAQRAGLLAKKPAAGASIKILRHGPSVKPAKEGVTMDLFEELK